MPPHGPQPTCVRVTRRLLNGQQQQIGQEEVDFYPVAEQKE
jgi:hypothetical protein